MGFDDWWVARIKECITSPSFSILIKGQPCGFFGSNRGIKQGDPLSPYLFTIVMEYFSCQMDIDVHKKQIRPLFPKVQPIISHLIYADDLLVFIEPSERSINSLNEVLEEFVHVSGLRINREKSHIYFNKDCPEMDKWSQMMQIERCQLPVRYLGLPLTINYARYTDCQGLLLQVQSKLEGWQSQLLSFGGRIELIRSVIYAIANYWMQAIYVPDKVIQKIEKLCANFLWRGGLHTIGWEELARPVEEGGVGIRALHTLREVALYKMAWQLIEGDSLWAQWTINRYQKKSNFWVQDIDNNYSVTYKNILRMRPILKNWLERVIVDGNTTNLWFDPWLSHANMVDRVGWHVFELIRRDEPLSTLIQNHHWRAANRPIGLMFRTEIEDIHIHMDGTTDRLEWAGIIDGKFLSRDVYEMTRRRGPVVEWAEVVWTSGVAVKMKLCIYKAIRNRLLTREQLARIGVEVANMGCVLCGGGGIETRDHLFFVCAYSNQVWQHCRRKSGFTGGQNSELTVIMEELMQIKDRRKDIFNSARIRLLSAVWHVWRERNRRIFEGIGISISGVINNLEADVMIMGKLKNSSRRPGL
ncbi:uncharacterized protein M6B38_100930 [Iris pallida]|uniref:Reverse transcriptase domain-containing protein n=1 Tax=Iris pallida TaxID=29817 RepID=A0AAX6ILX2_IRIPA|nr:uncharacterized protein M6B38_100930 [Iris pallida]